MKAEEFLIRFLAFHERLNEYQKPLASFLNTFVEHHREDTAEELEVLEQIFFRALEAAEALLGDLAFAIFDLKKGNEVESSFNAALFDAEMVAISRSGITAQQVTARKRAAFITDLGNELYDERFRIAIARATSDGALVKRRIGAVEKIIRAHF